MEVLFHHFIVKWPPDQRGALHSTLLKWKMEIIFHLEDLWLYDYRISNLEPQCIQLVYVHVFSKQFQLSQKDGVFVPVLFLLLLKINILDW